MASFDNKTGALLVQQWLDHTNSEAGHPSLSTALAEVGACLSGRNAVEAFSDQRKTDLKYEVVHGDGSTQVIDVCRDLYTGLASFCSGIYVGSERKFSDGKVETIIARFSEGKPQVPFHLYKNVKIGEKTKREVGFESGSLSLNCFRSRLAMGTFVRDIALPLERSGQINVGSTAALDR